MTIWGDAVESDGGGCSCLLWGPNLDGARPWSDSPAGKERLEHCKLALEAGAEGLLVHGERLDGHLPEDKARTVHGVDPETVLSFNVEKRGAEYWAVWGRKTAPSRLKRCRLVEIRACIFDVFGTTVDWRASVSRDLAAFAKQKAIVDIDWVRVRRRVARDVPAVDGRGALGAPAVGDPRRAAHGEPGRADRALRASPACRRPTSST